MLERSSAQITPLVYYDMRGGSFPQGPRRVNQPANDPGGMEAPPEPTLPQPRQSRWAALQAALDPTGPRRNSESRSEAVQIVLSRRRKWAASLGSRLIKV
jgi:hypothetical protein